MQRVGHESDKDVRFDANFLLVMDGPERQIPLQVFERFFDVCQLGIELPHLGRVPADQVRAQADTGLPVDARSVADISVG